MKYLHKLGTQILLEQDTTLSVLRKSISERIPISIYYKGPAGEVREGQRNDIEPIALGKNSRSGNLVIWAYVFKGVSKKGIPGWKMFRVDRINSAKFNLGAEKFKLDQLPGYVKGKAPSMMKSLSTVEIFSPYWFDDKGDYTPDAPQPTEVPVQPPVQKPIQPKQPDNIPPSGLANKVYQELTPQIRDVDGRRVVSKMDYDNALSNFSGYQTDQFKKDQKIIGGNERPGEGTRNRFNNTSKFELDRLLAKDDINVEDNENEMLAESVRIKFKRLTNW